MHSSFLYTLQYTLIQNAQRRQRNARLFPAIFLYAYAFGPIPGLVCAFAYSILNIFSDPYILHPVQLLLDYLLPFTLMGLAGIFRFKKSYVNIAAGIIFCVLLRYACHIASGIIFWDAWEYPPGRLRL